MQEEGTIQTQDTKDNHGRFDVKIRVYSAPSGTQYVSPIDLLFSKEDLQKYIQEAREKMKSTSAAAGG